MFGLFKSKTKLEKLQDEYKAMLEKSYKLSHNNRAESDKLRAEAEKIAEEIERLKQQGA
jgi:hypothetical protein